MIVDRRTQECKLQGLILCRILYTRTIKHSTRISITSQFRHARRNTVFYRIARCCNERISNADSLKQTQSRKYQLAIASHRQTVLNQQPAMRMMVLSNVPWDCPWQYSSQRKRKREFESFALENLPLHWLPKPFRRALPSR